MWYQATLILKLWGDVIMEINNGCDLGKALYNNADTIYICEDLVKSIIKIRTMKKSSWKAVVNSFTSNIPYTYSDIIIETPYPRKIPTLPEIIIFQLLLTIGGIKGRLSRSLISGYVPEMENVAKGAIIAANGHNSKEAVEIVFKRLRSYRMYKKKSSNYLKAK